MKYVSFTGHRDIHSARISDRLYETLENEIIPTFYNRTEPAACSPEWMVMVKNAIRTLSPMFCTRRMVSDYVRKMYIPAMEED